MTAANAPQSEQVPASLPAVAAAEGKKHGPARKPGIFFFFFGVILPLLALIFETTTHYCAQHFFDPFPSAAHILLFLLIPLTNFMTWLASRRDLSAFYLFIALGNGMALGIGCLYTLMFLPISGTACLGILFLGFGLLAFAPLLSLPCSWLAGKSVCSLSADRRTFFDAHQMEHIGHLVILIMVVAIELPSTLTRVYLGEAADANSSAKSQAAISWLRKHGSQEVMLRACYERSGRATDILGSIAEHVHPVSMPEARSIFYQVTGKPFNSVPIPASARATIKNTSLVDDPADLNAGVKDDFDYDADIAGETVSGNARGLAVSSSKLTGTVDADALLAVMDWTFGFQNSSTYDREARCKILLPPGAVVTKAVMTVDGVAHEAIIQERQEARETYTAAVKARKNPLLVSVCGNDQVLVQCYPIRHGSNISVSLKIVAPATLGIDQSQATLVLPSFSEKNFQADVPLQIDGLSTGASSHALTSVGEKGDKQLSRFDAVLRLQRNAECKSVYSNDSWTDMNSVVKRLIRPEQHQTPAQLIVVIDGSLQMRGRMADIVEGLKALPPTVPTEVVLVSDRDQFLCKAGTKPPDAAFKQAMQTLAEYQPVGGQDDSIVVRALARGKAKPGTQVLWIHGAQPSAGDDGTSGVKYFLQQAGVQPALYDLQVAAGPNEFLAFADSCPSLITVAPTGSISSDLKHLYSTWTNKVDANLDEYVFLGKRIEGDTAQKTLPELAQLMAYDSVLRHASSPNRAEQRGAGAIALHYHLITPATSAIVVEDIPQLAGEITAPLPVVDQWLANLNLQAFVDQAFSKVTSDLNRLNTTNESKQQVADVETIAPAPVAERQEELAQGVGATTGGGESSSSQDDALLDWAGRGGQIAANKPMAGMPSAAPTSSVTGNNIRLRATSIPQSGNRFNFAPNTWRGAQDAGLPSQPNFSAPVVAGGGGSGGGDVFGTADITTGGANSSNYTTSYSTPLSGQQQAPELQGATNGTIGPGGVIVRDERESGESLNGKLLYRQKTSAAKATADDKLMESEKEPEKAYNGDRSLQFKDGNLKYDQMSQSAADRFNNEEPSSPTASADAPTAGTITMHGAPEGSFRMDYGPMFMQQMALACVFWIAMLVGFGFAANLILVLVRNARKDPVPNP